MFVVDGSEVGAPIQGPRVRIQNHSRYRKLADGGPRFDGSHRRLMPWMFQDTLHMGSNDEVWEFRPAQNLGIGPPCLVSAGVPSEAGRPAQRVSRERSDGPRPKSLNERYIAIIGWSVPADKKPFARQYRTGARSALRNDAEGQDISVDVEHFVLCITQKGQSPPLVRIASPEDGILVHLMTAVVSAISDSELKCQGRSGIYVPKLKNTDVSESVPGRVDAIDGSGGGPVRGWW